jgi:hypothetical protein
MEGKKSSGQKNTDKILTAGHARRGSPAPLPVLPLRFSRPCTAPHSLQRVAMEGESRYNMYNIRSIF